MSPETAITPADYLRLAREVAAHGPSRFRLAVVSSFTAELLRPFLIVEGHAIDHRPEPWFAPFGQLEPLVVEPDSSLWRFDPHVVWLALRVEDIDRHLQLETDPAAIASRLHALVDRIVGLARSARAHSTAALLVSNLAPSSLHRVPAFDAADPDGFTHQLAEANRRLARELRDVGDAHLFDYGAVTGAVGSAWPDPRLFFMARAPASAAGQIALSRAVVRAAAALVAPAIKCVVVDLDGTLWGGVLGDDGIDQLALGDDYPGNAFKELQASLLGLRRRGVLLAVASKNDAAAAAAAVDRHPEMLLRRADFAAFEASWEPKPVMLRRIASSLNIGTDALLLVDDNPAERAHVRAELPEVRVVELPRDPSGYVAALTAEFGLDRPRVLDEDRRRAEMYAQNVVRAESMRVAVSVEEALARLHMVARVGTVTDETIARVHQLVHKTNQFNLTTRRHSQETIEQLGRRGRAAWLRLADDFGDLGLVSVGIVVPTGADGVWEIDTLLMSCRVMGRRVETAFLSYLGELAAAAGAQRLRGRYIASAKNVPVARLYPDHGFAEVQPGVYEIDLAEPIEWPAIIERYDHGAR